MCCINDGRNDNNDNTNNNDTIMILSIVIMK